MKKFCLALFAIAAALAITPTALADSTLYFQGFETDTSGWTASGTIAQVPSGTGGITAASGNYFAQITNLPDDYESGYGDYGYTFFNGNSSLPPTAYPGSPFSQSVEVYIDPTQVGTNYWIDMTPDSITDDNALPISCYPAACSDEQSFNLVYTGAGVAVSVTGGSTPIAILTTPGWYTFQGTYSQGATPTSLVSTNMNIYSGTNLVGSESVLGDSDGATLESDNLGGPGYLWFTVAQDGDGTLAIDNIEANTLTPTPEPSSLLLLGTGLLGLAFVAFRRAKASGVTF